MPSKSPKQKRLMAACCKNRKSMKGKCPPEKVACEYMRADKSKKKPVKKQTRKTTRTRKGKK